MQNENTPTVAKEIPMCSLSTIKKASSVSKETSNDESESDNRSEAQYTEVPTIQVLSETILENSEFQNVLVQNINRMLRSPDQPLGSQQNQNASSSNAPAAQADRSYQEQIDTAVDNIMKVTEENPLFDSLINEFFYNKPDTGNNRKPNASTSTPQKCDEDNGSNIPIKQRLRQRKSTVDQTLDQTNNDKFSVSSKCIRKRDSNKSVTVLSNETICKPEKALKKQVDIPAPVPQVFLVDPSNGTITAQTQLLEQIDTATTTTNTSSTSTDNFLIGLNPPQSYQIMGSWQSVVVNNSGTITYTDNPNQQYFEPGSIINFDAIHVNIPPAPTNDAVASQSLQPCIAKIDDEVVEAVKNIPMTSRKSPTQEHIVFKAETPPVSSQMNDVKNKSLSTPRRTSHIRVLDFNDALPGKIEAVRSRLDDFTDAPHMTPSTTADINCPIPGSAPPKLNRLSGPETTPTATQLDDAILTQESSDTSHFARDIDEDTVVSVELSIPDTPSRPKIKRNPRQLSARKSSKAETSQRPLRKSKRRQVLSSVVSTESQPIPAAIILETEPKKDKMKTTAQLQEWERLRSVKPGEWDNHMRAQFCRTGKATTYKRAPRKKKQKITKNTCVLQVSIDSKDSSIRTISPNSSLTEEHGQLLANALASAKKNPSEPDILNEAIAGALERTEIVPLNSHVIEKNIKQLPKRTKPIQIRLSPTKSVKKSQPLLKSSKSIIKNASELQASSNPLKKQPQNDEINFSPIDTINTNTLPTISPIGCSSNLAKLLETPYKEAAPDGIPFTPRFDLPNKSQETPLLKQIRLQSENMSTIKSSQFPTPSFPITPGFALTSLSKECSPRIGAYNTRPTDYSSSSSYYRPDESDDVDKNLEALIRSGRIDDVVPSQTTINKSTVGPSVSTQKSDMDYLLNCSDSSGSSSSQSFSSGTSSSDSSSSSETDETDDNAENPSDMVPDPQSKLGKQEQQELISILTESPTDKSLAKLTIKSEIQEKNQLELEKKRSRVMCSLKISPPIEKFKPKGSLVDQKGKLARKQGLSAAVASAQQKPISFAAPKPSTSTHPPIIATIAPSKRKVTTPRKEIGRNQITINSVNTISFVAKKVIQTKPNSITELDEKKFEKQTNEEAILDTIQAKAITEAKKTSISESIHRLTKEQDTFKSSTLEVCSEAISRNNASCLTTKATPSKTPTAIVKKQDNTDNATHLRLSRNSTDVCIDTLQHCFGDGTLSDSDFMDTPVKKTYGYDERCPDVLPALSLMPTPNKVSHTLKCVAKKSPAKPPDVTREKKLPATTMPLTVPSPSSIVQLIAPPVKEQLCEPIRLVSPSKIAMDQNDSSLSESDSDEDPYKECCLSLATETSINCAYQVVSSSVIDSLEQATSTRQPVIFPILNLVSDYDRRIRISVTDDIELFSAEPAKTTFAATKSIAKSKDTKNRIIDLPNQSSKHSSSDSKRSVPDAKIKTVQIQKGSVDIVGKRFVLKLLPFEILY